MAIAKVQSGLGSEDGTVNAWVTSSVSASPNADDVMLVFVALSDTTKTVTGLTDGSDGGPMTYTFLSAVTLTGVRLECWICTATKTGTSFIRANLSGMTPCAIAQIEYSGVAAFGTNGSANNTNADPTIDTVTQDANNVVVAGFGSVGATLATTKTGTLDRTRNSAGVNPVVCSMVRNTGVSPGTLTDAVTLAATTWAAIAVELRSTVGAGGGALPSRSLLGVGV